MAFRGILGVHELLSEWSFVFVKEQFVRNAYIMFRLESVNVFFTATWRWRQCTKQCGWQWGAQPCVSCSSRCGHGWSKGGKETYFQGSRLSGAWEFIIFLQGTKPHFGKFFLVQHSLILSLLSSHFVTSFCYEIWSSYSGVYWRFKPLEC